VALVIESFIKWYQEISQKPKIVLTSESTDEIPKKKIVEAHAPEKKKLNTNNFYSNYFGHKIDHLETLYNHIKETYPKKKIVWLAGDSTMDNKHFIADFSKPALNGYETILHPPRSKPDVAYQLNKALEGSDYVVINTAREESTIWERVDEGLFEQDQFIRDHIGPDDILIISCGGNDIALKATLTTSANLLALIYLNSEESIKTGSAYGFPHFHNLFNNDYSGYISKLISKQVPKNVIVNTLYFLDERQTGGWADNTLSMVQYNSNPGKLQTIIRQIHHESVSKINIPNVKVTPFKMYEHMDGKDSNDYVDRVEPSEHGGRKLAAGLKDIIHKS